MRTLSDTLDRREFESHRTRRDRLEQARSRAHLLTSDDRALLRLHLDAGHSFSQIARLLGLRRGTVARRLRRIAVRLADPTYPLCLRRRRRFSKAELIFIRDFFVRGRSMRQISRDRAVSYYAVRTAVNKAQQLVAATGAGRAETTTVHS